MSGGGGGAFNYHMIRLGPVHRVTVTADCLPIFHQLELDMEEIKWRVAGAFTI